MAQVNNPEQALSELRQILAQSAGDLAKATGTFVSPSTATTGLQQYNLETAVKQLYPVFTTFRNRLPRDKATGGTQANWKAVTGINSGNQTMGVGEGNRGGLISVSTADYFANFKTIGLEASVTVEAELSGEGFDDLRARAVRSLLESAMIGEEKLIIGGNATLLLGTTPTPTLSALTTGGSLGAALTVSVICIALTYEGLQLASTTDGIGVRGQITRQNTDGSTDTFGGGSAQASANATVVTSGAAINSVVATVPPVRGACGYAWFYGPAGSEKLGQITTASKATITAYPTGPNLASVPASSTQDNSRNPLIFDGMLSMNANINTGANWIGLQPGATLTSDGLGGIVEWDTMLQWFWDVLRMSPSRITMNSQESLTVRRKILGSTGAQTSRFAFSVAQGQIVGGGIPQGYLNPFAQGTGPSEIPLEIHPYMPPGTILFTADKLPYPINNVPVLARILARKDYYQYEWPMRSRKYEYGVYSDEVLQHYFPASIGVISNISPG